MRHLDLFSGIGGFALAAREVWGDEHEIVGFSDNDHFCQNVLAKNFPGVPVYGDIRELTADRLASNARSSEPHRVSGQRGSEMAETGERHQGLDLLTGGFPCQPFSNAGKKRGDKDDRFLWPEMLRVIRETRPTWVLGENVAGIINMALDQVCSDLENEGYEVQPFVIPACAVNAPHRRDRVWIVARRGVSEPSSLPQDPIGPGGRHHGNPTGDDREIQTTGHHSGSRYARNSDIKRLERHGEPRERSDKRTLGKTDWERDWREVALETCSGHDRVDDGISERLAGLSKGITGGYRVLPGGDQGWSLITQARWRKEALKAYGNSIVPQVAVEIMKAIKHADSLRSK